ncbi:MAG: AraC family transcriptional regulator [Alkalispirochaeta sp.]
MKNQHDEGRRDGQFVLSTPTEVENELPFQLIGAGCDFYQYPIERPFGFPVYQWIQTIRGRGVLEAPAVRGEAGENQGLLLYPDEEHTYYAVEEPWYVHWISFSGHHIPSMLHYLDMDHTGVYGISDGTTTASRIRKALSTLQSDYPLRGIDGSAIIYQLLLDFLKHIQRPGEASRETDVKRLKPALDLIETEMHRPLSLDDLAGSVGVTPQYFCDLFRSITSRRPTEYINQRRVDRAKELLLREPKTRVHDIGKRVGFESDSYFSTVFRKYEGISPRRYRETNAGNAHYTD